MFEFFAIQKWEQIASQFVLVSEEIILYAKNLQGFGFSVKDSIHIACAVEAKAKYFITVDKNILRKKNTVTEIILVNPVELVGMEDEI